MPKVGKYVIKAFTVDNMEAMLSACDTSSALGFRNYTMVALMADTGIRLGELIGLTIDNFYQVNSQGKSQGKSHIKVLGNGKREREVGVSPQVARTGGRPDTEVHSGAAASPAALHSAP